MCAALGSGYFVAFGGELPTYLASWVNVHFRIATQKLIGLAWRIGERR